MPHAACCRRCARPPASCANRTRSARVRRGSAWCKQRIRGWPGPPRPEASFVAPYRLRAPASGKGLADAVLRALGKWLIAASVYRRSSSANASRLLAAVGYTRLVERKTTHALARQLQAGQRVSGRPLCPAESPAPRSPPDHSGILRIRAPDFQRAFQVSYISLVKQRIIARTSGTGSGC